MHQPIEERLKHPADFRVRYEFYKPEHGGRKSLPFQGYRSDFWYDHDGHVPTAIYMIWPEFEDEQGKVILENTSPVSVTGTAKMWIIAPETREYHRNKIKPGLIGYFMEAFRKVATCEVIEVVGLSSNPTS